MPWLPSQVRCRPGQTMRGHKPGETYFPGTAVPAHLLSRPRHFWRRQKPLRFSKSRDVTDVSTSIFIEEIMNKFLFSGFCWKFDKCVSKITQARMSQIFTLSLLLFCSNWIRYKGFWVRQSTASHNESLMWKLTSFTTENYYYEKSGSGKWTKKWKTFRTRIEGSPSEFWSTSWETQEMPELAAAAHFSTKFNSWIKAVYDPMIS